MKNKVIALFVVLSALLNLSFVFADNEYSVERAIQNKSVTKTFQYAVQIPAANNFTATIAIDVTGYYQIDVASGMIVKGYNQSVGNQRFVVAPPNSGYLTQWRIELLETSGNPIVSTGDKVTFSGSVKVAIVEIEAYMEKSRVVVNIPYSLVHSV